MTYTTFVVTRGNRFLIIYITLRLNWNMAAIKGAKAVVKEAVRALVILYVCWYTEIWHLDVLIIKAAVDYCT